MTCSTSSTWRYGDWNYKYQLRPCTIFRITCTHNIRACAIIISLGGSLQRSRDQNRGAGFAVGRWTSLDHLPVTWPSAPRDSQRPQEAQHLPRDYQQSSDSVVVAEGPADQETQSRTKLLGYSAVLLKVTRDELLCNRFRNTSGACWEIR